MKRSWIVFKIGGISVHQMSDNGFTGKDTIENIVTMVASQNKVNESNVIISFMDEVISGIVGSNMLRDVRLGMTNRVFMN